MIIIFNSAMDKRKTEMTDILDIENKITLKGIQKYNSALYLTCHILSSQCIKNIITHTTQMHRKGLFVTLNTSF